MAKRYKEVTEAFWNGGCEKKFSMSRREAVSTFKLVKNVITMTRGSKSLTANDAAQTCCQRNSNIETGNFTDVSVCFTFLWQLPTTFTCFFFSKVI